MPQDIYYWVVKTSLLKYLPSPVTQQKPTFVTMCIFVSNDILDTVSFFSVRYSLVTRQF